MPQPTGTGALQPPTTEQRLGTRRPLSTGSNKVIRSAQSWSAVTQRSNARRRSWSVTVLSLKNAARGGEHHPATPLATPDPARMKTCCLVTGDAELLHYRIALFCIDDAL